MATPLPQPSWLRPVVTSQSRQHRRTAAACYFLLGAGILAPWNALISGADYFAAVFPAWHVERLMTLCYLPPCLLLLGVVIKWNTLPARPRILTSFAAFTAIMLALPLVDALLVGGRPVGPDSALGVLLAVVVAVGVLDGLSQGAIFGDAADLPPEYTHAVVGGTASSGVIISFLRIITKAALPPTRAGLRQSTALYFALASGACLACVLVYAWVLPRLGVVQYYKRQRRESALELSPQPSILEAEGAAHALHDFDDDDGRPLVRHNDKDPQLSHGSSQHLQGGSSSPHAGQQPQCGLGPGVPQGSAQAAALDAEAHHGGLLGLAGTGAKQPLSWWHVLTEAWPSVLALFLCYVVTLSLFPGVLAEDIKSDVLGSWYPVLLICLFNCCDLAGKCMPTGSFAPSPRMLLWASVSRAVFVPAFWCAGKYAGSVVWLMASLTTALGVSNGLLTALLMTLAPRQVEVGEAGLVENLLVFSLVAGLTVGAVAGWLWLL